MVILTLFPVMILITLPLLIINTFASRATMYKNTSGLIEPTCRTVGFNSVT